jgi:hypothetical protein
MDLDVGPYDFHIPAQNMRHTVTAVSSIGSEVLDESSEWVAWNVWIVWIVSGGVQNGRKTFQRDTDSKRTRKVETMCQGVYHYQNLDDGIEQTIEKLELMGAARSMDGPLDLRNGIYKQCDQNSLVFLCLGRQDSELLDWN